MSFVTHYGAKLHKDLIYVASNLAYVIFFEYLCTLFSAIARAMTDYTTYCPDSVLFERNPVCGVCWRVCMDMCEEWGGPIQFDLLASMEAADKLCQRLINNTWTLRGIEYYYHWLEAQLGFSRAALTCATATVCLSLRLMDDAPEPLQQMGADMLGLLWGEGGELYDNMRCAARQQDICLTATNYGEIPPDPNEEIKTENVELRYQVDQLSHELQTMSKQGEQYTIGTQNNNCTIYNAPVTINQYDKSSEVSSQPSDVTEVVVEEQHFSLLTAQCIKEGKAQKVEDELRSAAKGSAQKLIKCIRTNEALGYLDTKNMSSQALYDALNAYFGLKYSVRNFTIARNK